MLTGSFFPSSKTCYHQLFHCRGQGCYGLETRTYVLKIEINKVQDKINWRFMSTTEANIYNHVLTVQNFPSKGDREMKYPKTPFYTIIGVITSPAIALALRKIPGYSYEPDFRYSKWQCY